MKSEQLEAVRLPMRAGKSLCYGCLPVVFDILLQNNSDTLVNWLLLLTVTQWPKLYQVSPNLVAFPVHLSARQKLHNFSTHPVRHQQSGRPKLPWCSEKWRETSDLDATEITRSTLAAARHFLRFVKLVTTAIAPCSS